MIDDPSQATAPLNEHQHRALSTRLGLLEQQLYEAERLTRDELGNGSMFETCSDLTYDEKEKLLRLLAQARQVIGELRDRFGLAPQRHDVRHWLLGHFSNDLSPQLDPQIDQLIEIVSSVRSLISSSS